MNVKNISTVFLCLLIFQINSLAQNNEQPAPNVDKLKLTSAPAYAVLGTSPSNIQRPSTPRDLAVDIQTAFKNGKLSPNFALEITPYFMTKQNEDTSFRNRYLVATNYVRDNNWGRNFLSHLSLSIATSSTDSAIYGKLKPGTGLGIGIKMNLVQGNLNVRINQLYEQWCDAIGVFRFYDVLAVMFPADNKVPVAQVVSNHIDTARARAILNVMTDRTIADNLRARIINAINAEASVFVVKSRIQAGASTNKEISDAISQVQTPIQTQIDATLKSINASHIGFTRTGFMLELAAAQGMAVPSNEWRDFTSTKTVIWLTPSYRLSVYKNTSQLIQYLDFMAVLRYTINSQKVDTSNYFDFGAKIQYTGGKFSVSYEGEARYASIGQTNWTYRSILNASYTIYNNVSVSLAFGTDFNGTTWNYTNPNQIFAVGGINLALVDLIKKR